MVWQFSRRALTVDVTLGRKCVIVPESNNMRRVKRRVEKAVVTTTMQDDDDPVLASGQLERRYQNIGSMLNAQADSGVGVALSGMFSSGSQGAQRVFPASSSSDMAFDPFVACAI